MNIDKVLEKATVTIVVEAEDLAVRGHFDEETEDEIIDRIEQGDVWAWAVVRVVANVGGLQGKSDWLGSCSYDDEADFRRCGYFEDLKNEALGDLRTQLVELERFGK